MRRFITFIALALCLFANAQVKRNGNGEKMVSKIIKYLRYNDTPCAVFSFHYDKNNKLVKLVKESLYSEEKYVYQREGNVITFSVYVNGKIQKNRACKYILNEKNKINFIEERDYNIQNYREFIKTTYQLEYDEYDRVYSMITRDFYEGTENNCKEEDIRTIRYYEWVNDNVYYDTHVYYWKERDVYRRDEFDIKIQEDRYNQFENDTNIDFQTLVLYNAGNYKRLPLMTEWSGFKTKNLFIKKGIRYDYLSEDDEYGDNNIIEFHEYISGRLSERYKLEYVKQE